MGKIRPWRPDFHRLGAAVYTSIATAPFSQLVLKTFHLMRHSEPGNHIQSVKIESLYLLGLHPILSGQHPILSGQDPIFLSAVLTAPSSVHWIQFHLSSSFMSGSFAFTFLISFMVLFSFDKFIYYVLDLLRFFAASFDSVYLAIYTGEVPSPCVKV